MPRDYRLYLEDMLDAINKITGYSQGMNLEKLHENPLIVDAVLYNLQIIGEAAKHLPEDLRSRYPTIEWRKIFGLRDLIAHEYFGVSLEIIWDILQNKLPDLREVVQQMLDLENDSG